MTEYDVEEQLREWEDEWAEEFRSPLGKAVRFCAAFIVAWLLLILALAATAGLARGSEPPPAWVPPEPPAASVPDPVPPPAPAVPPGYHAEVWTDGVTYWVRDGCRLARGEVSLPAPPFGSAGTTRITGATPAATSPRPEPGRGSSAGTIRTAPTITLAPGAATPGSTDGCPPSG